MEKQFVTYEIALKLKELGFDEECMAMFNLELKLRFIKNKTGCPNGSRNSECEPNVLAPLWQQVINWFREEHDVIIDVAKIFDGTDNYHFAINLKWEYFSGTYYEALENSILKAIELIK